MKTIASLFLLAIYITHAWGHSDSEGSCAAALPAYPRDDGTDIASFDYCECENLHGGAGSASSLVVCGYSHISGNGSNNEPGTGSCDAKTCLFTQECKMPVGFDPSKVNVKQFDSSMFKQWCVDKEEYLQLAEPEEGNPTPSAPTTSPTETKQNNSPVEGETNIPNSSKMCNHILALFLMGAAMIISI